ncbi:MAG TPA: glycosyltransferase 87 family protein [Gaiellaceae bacterium]|nr:glycosyltransferase 87 family protein [Gaiellaceae bacterium]
MSARAALRLLGGAVVGVAVVLGLVLDRPDPFARPATLVATIVAALAVYGLAAAVVLRGHPLGRWAFALVLLVAVVARLALAVHPPTLSDDAYRYVWDGRVQAAGINPYRSPPESPALAHLRDDAIYERVNRKFAPTIYPPAAQGFFRAAYAIHPDSIRWTKVALVLVDAVAIMLLGLLLVRFGRPPEHALLYAWHPLAIVEVGHSGHIDVVAVALLLGSLLLVVRGRPLAAGVALAGASLVKFYALVALIPLLARGRARLVGALAVTAVLAYLPFLSVGTRVLGYLPGYLSEEGFESGARFYLLRVLGAESPAAVLAYELAAAGILAALALAVWRRVGREPESIALLLLAGLALATPAYPWYALLPLALLPLAGPRVLAVGSFLAAAAFLLYVQQKAPGNPGWPLHVVWGGTTLALAAAGLSKVRARLPRVAYEG